MPEPFEDLALSPQEDVDCCFLVLRWPPEIFEEAEDQDWEWRSMMIEWAVPLTVVENGGFLDRRKS